MTLQLNKKHLLFQIQRPKVSSQNIFWVTTEEKSKADLKQTFLERTKRHFGKLVFFFQWNRPKLFGGFVRKSSKQLHTIQNDEDHVSEKIKSCFFLSIRYRKTSQTQDVKSQSTERSVRKKGQLKRDTEFEQKTRIVSCRESFCFAQKTKAVFISIRYPNTSQTQDVKSEGTKPNLRKLAQPKRDSAFEQKTRIVSSRVIWGSSQNRFF